MRLRDELLNAYSRRCYDYFCTLFDEYVKSGVAIDYHILICYLWSLVKTRRYEDAYKVCKLIEGTNKNNNPDINYDIFLFYLFSFKPKDAERVLHCGNINIKNKVRVVETYLLLGDIKKAQDILLEYLKTDRSSELLALQSKINNHTVYNAFIETEYQSFISNGNKLEPGHIVYLKHSPNSANDIEQDPKVANRPYMIWKFEGKVIYLFPVTSSVDEKGYKLFKQKYRNSIGDRTIKGNLCFTTEDNILSVCDKVLDEDWRTLLKSAYDSVYLNRSRQYKSDNQEFLQQFYEKAVEKNNIIVIADPITRERKYYFVIDIKDTHYEVIELDYDNQVVSGKVELFRKTRFMYFVKTPTAEQIEEIRKAIPNNLLIRSFLGAKIETAYGKFIVLAEKNGYCVCINDLFSPSYINLTVVKKDEILNTYGFISKDEVEDIRGIVTRNSKQSIDNLLRKCK